jgi:hypothetical protein
MGMADSLEMIQTMKVTTIDAFSLYSAMFIIQAV